ncbi:MAG TPA: mandelate racemase/muconate lactonizing enzyme family protein [Tepidisphaeraceae bacterium]|nr:mandelate racemase/muconate lactonizing enzyme family protein [Tepidisphaeraceae bacterium]
MKITDIRWHPVKFVFRELEKAAYGHRTGWVNLVIEVETNEGITGIGEVYTASGAWLQAIMGALSTARQLFIGQDPRNIELLTRLFYRVGNWRTLPNLANMTFSGVEMALWDILGKSIQQPVHRLFGGAVREQIGFYGYLYRKAPAEMAKEAKRLATEGYRVLYFKVGLDRRADFDAVEAVRAGAGPNVAIRIDANQAWGVGTAVQRIKELQRFNLDFVEQPVAGHDWKALAQVRRRVDVPIAANEGIWTAFDALQVIRHDAADVIVAGTSWVGGLMTLKKIASIAEAGGIQLCRHCPLTAIGTAAEIQVISTFGNLMDGNQQYLSEIMDEVIQEPMSISQGSVAVPQRPGIGVTLDKVKLAQNAFKSDTEPLIQYYANYGDKQI